MDSNEFNGVNYNAEYTNFNRTYLECESMFAQVDRLIQEELVKEAVELLFKIVQCDPQFGKAYNYLGWVYENKYKKYAQAEEYYKNAMKYVPEYAASYLNYAYFLSNCGRFDELKAHLDIAMTIPTVSKETIYSEYAVMYEVQQKLEEAMDYYLKAAMTTLDTKKLTYYKESIDRCKMKLELKNSFWSEVGSREWEVGKAGIKAIAV